MHKTDIEQLQAVESYPSISMVIPGNKASALNEEQRIRLKNVVRKCEQLLLQNRELSKRDVRQLIDRLNEHIGSIDLQSAGGGLAIFANAALVESYNLDCPVNERLTISDHFATTELVQAFDSTIRYLVLVLSESEARLLSGQNATLSEERIGEFPLRHVVQENPSQRIVSSAPSGSGWETRTGGAMGGLPGTYVPDIESYREERLRRFFRKVDEALANTIKNDCLPVFLTGTRRNLDEFRKITAHSAAIAGTLEGSYDHAPVSQIEASIQPIVQAYLKSIKEGKLRALDEARNRKLATSGFDDCMQSAADGRCQTLIIEESFDAISGSDNNDEQNDGETAISNTDKIIEEVWKHGGEVVFVEPGSLTGSERIAAINRF